MIDTTVCLSIPSPAPAYSTGILAAADAAADSDFPCIRQESHNLSLSKSDDLVSILKFANANSFVDNVRF
jgi:predicted TIM-barrel enzyme